FLVNAVNFQIELDARDAPAGARHFEVHVAEVVFVTHDVGQQHKAVLFLDQADGDAGHRIGNGHAGVHEGQSAAAHAGHAARAVRFENVGDNANRVRELIRTGDDGLETALGQSAVADLSPARSANRPALAHAKRREVV